MLESGVKMDRVYINYIVGMWALTHKLAVIRQVVSVDTKQEKYRVCVMFVNTKTEGYKIARKMEQENRVGQHYGYALAKEGLEVDDE